MGVLRELHTKVVGVTKKNDEGERIQELLEGFELSAYEGMPILLEHDVCNEYDDNAIKVVLHCSHIGYLNRELAAEIVDAVDEGCVEAELSEITGGEGDKSYGCNILLRILDTPSEHPSTVPHAKPELPAELVDAARSFVTTVPTVSVATLQRQFSLGYTNAAALMDKLEELGDVGPFQGATPRNSLTYTKTQTQANLTHIQPAPKLIDRIFKPVMITLGILIALCVVALIGIRSPRKEYDGPIALTRPPVATENSISSPSPEPTPDGRFDNLEEIVEQVKALYTPLLQVGHANGIPTGTSLSIAVSTPDLEELYTQCQDKDTAAWDKWEAKEAELVEATAGVADVMAGFGDERTVMVQIVSTDERIIYFTLTNKGATYDAVDAVREQVAQAEAAAAAAEQAKKDREERIASAASSGTSSDTKYILNTSSKVFHRPGCSRADAIDADNRRTSYSSRSSLIEQGYTACGSCNP